MNNKGILIIIIQYLHNVLTNKLTIIIKKKIIIIVNKL